MYSPMTIEAEATTREENNATLIAALNEPPLSARESSWDLEIINDAERGRWIAVLGADAIAELMYRYVGGRVVLLTAWVDPGYRHNRVATELIAHVLDEVRESGKKITIICPVVGEFIAHNQEYLGLIDQAHPGSGAYPKPPADERRDDAQEIDAFEHDLT